MDASLPKIDTLEKHIEHIGVNRSTATLDWPYNPTGYLFYPTDPGNASHNLVPEGFFPDDYTPTLQVTEQNFWLDREARRFHDRTYSAPGFLHVLRDNNRYVVHARKLWQHFVHVSLNNPSMISFTPSWEYGLRDRQVIMKVGKYLTRFYSDVMTPEEIRDIVNRFSARTILWAQTMDEIIQVYEDGPSSCMSGALCGWEDSETFDGIHPVSVYGYVYENGEREFNVAYLTNSGGEIVARALVAMRVKKFIRCYGDDGPILESHLRAEGYELVGDMGAYGLRLKKFYSTRGRFIMPYLDGCSGVKERGDYWEWNSTSYDHYADNSCGLMGDEADDRPICSVCDDHCDADDIQYSHHHDLDICDHCQSGFTHAYYECSSDETLVRNDQVVYCETYSSYYLKRSSVLDWHEIVKASDGKYYETSDEDIFCDSEGNYHHVDEVDNFIESHNGIYFHRDGITNNWRGRESYGDWVWFHPDYPPDDLRITTWFMDDFGTEHRRVDPNPIYVSPGQLWSIMQDDLYHDVHNMCDHIEDLGEEWEDEATRPDASPTPKPIMAIDSAAENVRQYFHIDWAMPAIRPSEVLMMIGN